MHDPLGTGFPQTREGRLLFWIAVAGTFLSLPNIGLATTDRVHRQDLTKLTPDVVKAYQDKWRRMFQG